MNIPTLSYPRHLQSTDDVSGCKYLGIYQLINAQPLEKLLLVLGGKLGIADLGHGLACSQRMCYDTGVDVQALRWRDRDKEVGSRDPGIRQGVDARRRGLHCHEVKIRANLRQPFTIIIYDGNIIVVA